MTVEKPASLHEVRTKWLRVQSEVAYLKMLFAGQRFREALRREEARRAGRKSGWRAVDGCGWGKL